MGGTATMDMPKVSRCDVTDCDYNMNNCCHTMAITIGDAMNPKCDSFCQVGSKGGDMSMTACVGSCKVSGCKFNSSLECRASEICVGYKGQDPDCLTFQMR